MESFGKYLFRLLFSVPVNVGFFAKRQKDQKIKREEWGGVRGRREIFGISLELSLYTNHTRNPPEHLYEGSFRTSQPFGLKMSTEGWRDGYYAYFSIN